MHGDIAQCAEEKEEEEEEEDGMDCSTPVNPHPSTLPSRRSAEMIKKKGISNTLDCFLFVSFLS